MTEPSPVPATLLWAVRLLWAQAAALAVVAGFLVYADFTAPSLNLRTALGVTGYAVVLTVSFGLLAFKLGQHRAWARGPAIVLELLLVPIGFLMIRGGLLWLGIPVLVLGLTGAALLLAPITRLYLTGSRSA